MNQVTIKSVGSKLQAYIDGVLVKDVVGFRINGTQGAPSTVELTIKAESVAVVTEAKEVKKEPEAKPVRPARRSEVQS